MPDERHVVVVTGMSGAGRSQAAKVLEDLGYFVVDNVPAVLIPALVENAALGDIPRPQVAVVVDSRAGLDFHELSDARLALEATGVPNTLLFLDASDDTLISRYEENRRPHPVAADTLSESIVKERDATADLRGDADVIIDTTDRSVHDLRRAIEDAFSGDLPSGRPMRVTITSFGFKRGLPRVLDLLFDVRFLPNPHWVEELRPQTGLDAAVRHYVLEQDDAKLFMEHATGLFDFLVPRYQAEGKSYLAIGVGCTGGHHRSVAIAEELADYLRAQGLEVAIRHRDVDT